MIISPRFIMYLFTLLFFILAAVIALFTFRKKLYGRLGARIALLVLTSGIVTLMTAIMFNELALSQVAPDSNTLTRILQIAEISLFIFGGPAVLGLLAIYFVRRPLRQFKQAITSLEQSNYKAMLQPTGIREFDEVFDKFNNLMNRLQHEEKLRKDLVSDTSHELNTPLTTMIGQLIAIEEGKYPMTKERVILLKEQAERLAELVHQLDAYTKARLPDIADVEEVTLKQFCDDLIRQFLLEFQHKNITVRQEFKDSYTIQANRGALQQIFTNLFQNTLRYSEATTVTISANKNVVTFSDNGKGVPAKSLPYLFERFYRVEESRSRATGGLGLGLAIVRELAESQGWSITASAGHPGLVFTLTLAAS